MSNTMRKFYDVEHDEVISLAELMEEFAEKSEDEREEYCGNFWNWLRECTGKNGTLEEIA